MIVTSPRLPLRAASRARCNVRNGDASVPELSSCPRGDTQIVRGPAAAESDEHTVSPTPMRTAVRPAMKRRRIDTLQYRIPAHGAEGAATGRILP